jgi:hypothetical protein
MTVALAFDEIVLTGDCGCEDAEPLLELLLSQPQASVYWRRCSRAHSAIVQLLLAAGRQVRGPADDLFLSRWVEPLLTVR